MYVCIYVLNGAEKILEFKFLPFVFFSLRDKDGDVELQRKKRGGGRGKVLRGCVWDFEEQKKVGFVSCIVACYGDIGEGQERRRDCCRKFCRSEHEEAEEERGKKYLMLFGGSRLNRYKAMNGYMN